MSEESKFLTAEWRYLAMLNFEVEPEILREFVPAGTTLDQWNGRTFVSMVGFLFLDTRILGVPIPFHRNFEEVNLRFYVKREVDGEHRRGVVFIKELVPKRAIAFVARTFYNENYEALPMGHSLLADRGVYWWKSGGRKSCIEFDFEGEPKLAPEGSAEEFITEHYWGYSWQRDGGTMEYKVEHPRWRVWPVKEARLECDVENLYGKQFAPFLKVPPVSAFLAEGSLVTVFKGKRLKVGAA